MLEHLTTMSPEHLLGGVFWAFPTGHPIADPGYIGVIVCIAYPVLGMQESLLDELARQKYVCKHN